MGGLYVQFNLIFAIFLKTAETAAVSDNAPMFSQDMGLEGSLLASSKAALRTLKLKLLAVYILALQFLPSTNFQNLKLIISMITQTVTGEVVFVK